MSEKMPAMISAPERHVDSSTCSSGACWEHDGYEWGIQIVGSPRMSVKTWFGTDPPIEGRTAGVFASADATACADVVAIVVAIEDRTNSAHG